MAEITTSSPSLNQFLSDMKAKVPEASDQDLTSYWEQHYATHTDQERPLPALDTFLSAMKTKVPDASDAQLRSYWQEHYGAKGAPEQEPGDVSRGLAHSFQQIPQLFGGVVAGAGAAAEKVVGEGGLATGLKSYGLRKYAEAEEGIAKTSKPTDSASTAYDEATRGNPGALVDWLQYAMGYTGGQILQGGVTAAAGNLAGRAVLKSTVQNMAERLVAKEAAQIAATAEGKALAQDELIKAATASVAGRLGSYATLATQATGMEGGEIFGDLTKQAQAEGRQLSGGELAKAFGYTIGAGALEFVGDKLGLDVVLKRSPINKIAEGVTGLTGRVLRGTGEAAALAPAEMATEFSQTILEQLGKGQDPLSDASIREAIDSGILGAVGGASVGGVTGAITPPKPPATQPELPESKQPALPTEANTTSFPDLVGVNHPGVGIDEAIKRAFDLMQTPTDAQKQATADEIHRSAVKHGLTLPTAQEAALLEMANPRRRETIPVLEGPTATPTETGIEVVSPPSNPPFVMAPNEDEQARAYLEQERSRLHEQMRSTTTPVTTEQPLSGLRFTGAGTVQGVPLTDRAKLEAQRRSAAQVNAAAHEAATSPTNALPEPTEAQKEAGNFQKGHLRIAGLDISIENPEGSERTGIDKNGKPWSVTMQHHYGYIKGTVGKDKDHLDVFVKPGTPEQYHGPVFVVDQKNPQTSRFDEHKVILGAASEQEAREIYAANYAKDWQGLRSIQSYTMAGFKDWLAHGDHKLPANPLAETVAFKDEQVSTPKQPTVAPAKPSDKQKLVAQRKPKLTDKQKLSDQRPKSETQPTGPPEITQSRSTLAPEQNTEMLLRAEKSQADIEIAGRERGGRFHLEQQGHGSTPEVRGLKSATAQWYKDLTSGPRPLKREQIETAIQKIIHDEGTDVGTAVERVKEALLHDREFYKTPWGKDAESIMRGEWPSWITKPNSPSPSVPPPAASSVSAPSRSQTPREGTQTETAQTTERKKEEQRHAEPFALTAPEVKQTKEKPGDTQTSIPMEPETVGTRPIIGRETTPEESPLFSKAAQEAEPEQQALPQSGSVNQPAEENPVPTTILANALRNAANHIEGKPLQDVGSKIGGARKDRWATRGLTLDDLAGMSGGEESKYVTKANIWKPDYAAMTKGGTDPKAAALLKIVYDRLAAKPAKDTPEGRREYVTMMGYVKEAYASVKTIDDMNRARQELLKHATADTGRLSQVYVSVFKDRSEPFHLDLSAHRRAAKMVHEGFPEQEPWTRRYSLTNYGDPNLTPEGVAYYEKKGGPWAVVEKSSKRVMAYKPDEASASEEAQRLYAETSTGKGKGLEPERPHLDDLKRSGAEYRNGKHVAAEDFRKQFGFRGVEFGNYAASDERQKHVDQAYDALMDLATLLGIPPQAISLNGTLGLAFGARGSGKAQAHYEPSKLVINITKVNGPGALAHEWGHALDHYFGELNRPDAYAGSPKGASGWRQLGNYTGSPERRYTKQGVEEVRRLPNLRPEMRQAFDRVMDALFHRGKTKAEAVREAELKLEEIQGLITKYEHDIAENKEKAATPPDKMTVSWLKQAEEYLQTLKIRQEVRGKNLTELTDGKEPDGGYGRVETSFYKQAQTLSGPTGDYWKRPTEMFARAFESYVFDRLGTESQYLVHSVEADRYTKEHGYKGNPYPEGPEREAIHAAFDHLFSTMESKETDNGTALFKREESTSGKFLSQADTQQIASRINVGDTPVRVMEYSSLPQAIQDEAQKQGYAPQEIQAVFHEGSIYLVADRFRSAEDVEQSVFHELYHKWVAGYLGQDMKAQLDSLFDKLGGPAAILKIAAKHEWKDAKSTLQAYGRRTDVPRREKTAAIVNELLAEMGARNLNPGLRYKLQEWIGAFRNWLRGHGFATLAKWTEADLAYLLKQAREVGQGRTDNATQFQRKENDRAPWDISERIPDYPGRSESDHISKIQMVPIDQVEPTETVGDAQIHQVERAAQVGSLPAIVAEFSYETESGVDMLAVVDGHARLAYAKRIGSAVVPVRVVVKDEDWDQVKAAGGMAVRRPGATQFQTDHPKGSMLGESVQQPLPTAEGQAYTQSMATDRGPGSSENAQTPPEPGRYITNTPSFRKWFKGSQVTDNNGKPLIVYHGGESIIDDFSRGANRATELGLAFFTSDKDVANSYAMTGVPPGWNGERFNRVGYVTEAYLSIKHPIPSDPEKFFDGDMAEAISYLEDDLRENDIVALKDYASDGYKSRFWQYLDTVEYRPLEGEISDSSESLSKYPFLQYISSLMAGSERFRQNIQSRYDGIIFDDAESGGTTFVVFRPNQIKTLPNSSGPQQGGPLFQRRESGAQTDLLVTQPQLTYALPELSRMDDVIRTIQDKNIDTVRLVEAIRKAGKAIQDEANPVLHEEMYQSRVAHHLAQFLDHEMRPLIDALRFNQVTLPEFERFLHARHAKEANAHLRAINPDLEHNEALSGMTDEEAEKILDSVDRAKMNRLATRVDALVQQSRTLMVEYGLESPERVQHWREQYNFYVPLHREGIDDERMGTGQGRSIRGSHVKQRTGSTKGVVDILANLALDRERTIVRGEKMRPVLALANLLTQYPNPDIAQLAKPTPLTFTDPETGLRQTAAGDVGQYRVPRIKTINKDTGEVEWRPDPLYKGRPNVVNFRIAGQDYALIFNEQNPRALKIAHALKDLDVGQLNTVLSATARMTRYLASINTQYNPVFGLVNFVRDAQFAMLTLQNTPLAEHKGKIWAAAVRSMKGIYTDARAVRRGDTINSDTAKLWELFQAVGGPTGYRDLFRTASDRTRAMEHLLDPDWWTKTKVGKVVTAGGVLAKPEQALLEKVGKPLFDWLSDYNLTMENAMRLGVFKVALEQGLSDLQAASLAKNVTINFNKKGQISAQMGSLYAFFNASVQGTARVAETLFEPGQFGTLSAVGKRIIAGGVTLGVLQAFALAMAGFDEDDPPDWIRARSLIIPVPGTDKGYVSIPMPLGFNVLPNVGRLAAETVMYGRPMERATHFLSDLLDAFSPVGGASSVSQFLAPSVADPIVALGQNRDWTGSPISREDFNSRNPTPGFSRTKDTSTPWSRGLAWAINYATGGTDYVPGQASPTPDQIDYLVAQLTGGVGREVSKAAKTATALSTGESLPLYHVPLAGRFLGFASGQSHVRDAFYRNLKTLNLDAAEITGRREHGEDAAGYLAEHPEARLVHFAQRTDRQVAELNKQKHNAIAAGASQDQIKLLDQQITARMERLNQAVQQVHP